MSKQKYVVEPRTSEGKLDVKRLSEIPFPVDGVTEEKLFDYYFRHYEGEKKYSEFGYGETASQEDIKKWYESKGWYIRPKTW